MASFTPYTYIQCPCHDASSSQHRQADDAPTPADGESPEDDDNDLDPRAPRSNFSLYPLEYLLYCDVCHQIRCPRCVAEEIVNIYCPNCLFEVASSSLKTEGNRCTRSCFQCPICVGPLAVQALESAPEPSLLSADNAAATPALGPWILACSYCNWSSSEIGIKFDKPQGISAQLSKIRHGDDQSRHQSISGDDAPSPRPDTEPTSTKARFSALKAFYQTQLNSTSSSAGISGISDYGLNSPGTLSRIMDIYSGNNLGRMKPKNKSTFMREAESLNEGLSVDDLDESAIIEKLRRDGWDATVTSEQADAQVEEGARFADELWPVPYLLRSKRSKRCPVCRHIISKPESKVGNTRWRIRLVANNYIPSISIKPLNPSGPSAAPNPAPSAAMLLKPLTPVQYLLTFKNPIFEDVKVTLATPNTTPGRFASKVTLLCPQFSIDANTDNDVYLEDVLKESGRRAGDDSSSATSATAAAGGGGGTGAAGVSGGAHQGEAGKIWERGRNWVSIVVEVVPASVKPEAPPALLRKEEDPEPDLGPLREDEDVLEIPLFVHLEWEGDVSQDQVGGTHSSSRGAGAGGREKKELAYWSVLGVGRIAPTL